MKIGLTLSRGKLKLKSKNKAYVAAEVYDLEVIEQ